jgi:hypothetical protein
LSAEALPPPRRRRRLGLYLPFGLLLLLAAGWSVGWLVIRSHVTAGLDEWIASEAAAGRRWSCADRAVGGYPFRIEIKCSEFTVDRPDVRASVGRLLVVSQIYRPRHIIAEASGPLRLKAGPTEADGRWKLLQASVMLADKGFDLIDLVVDEPVVSLHEPGGIPVDLSSRRFEGHLRPLPEDRTAMQLAMSSKAAVIPGLNELLGGKDPADTAFDVVITQTDDLPARPLWSELERWRAAGGVVRLTSLKVVKGQARLEGTGRIGIDAQHRPDGQLDLAAAGLGGVLGQLTSGGGGLLGALLGGGGRAPDQATPGAPLKQLPPLRLQGGRLLVGPLPIPGVRIPSLY